MIHVVKSDTDKPAPGEALRRENRVVDPMQFYTAGVGKDASPMSVRVPYALRHAVDELIASRETPFKTPGEVVRSALAWFIHGVLPVYRAQRLDDALKQLNNYLAEAENDALVMNVGRLQTAGREKIGALLRIGAKRDAAIAYLRMLRVAHNTHPKLGRLMEAWAEAEALFDPLRAIAEEIAAAMAERPSSKCAVDGCEHTRSRHVLARDKEGHEFIPCSVKGCHCEDWQFDPPDFEDMGE